jgi:hypothetical protein
MKVWFSPILLLFLTRSTGQSFYGVEFIENKGQWKDDYAYKSVLGNGVAYFHKNGFTISITHPDDFARVIERVHGGGSPSTITSPLDNLTGVGSKDNASVDEHVSSNNKTQELILRSHAYRVNFIGSSPNANFIPSKPTGNEANYFIGNDSNFWKTDVRSYGEVILKDVYPGTNIRYYSGNEKIKYDLILAPGAEPSKRGRSYCLSNCKWTKKKYFM